MHPADPALSPLQFSSYKIVNPEAERKRKHSSSDADSAKKPCSHGMDKLRSMMQRQLSKIVAERAAGKKKVALLQQRDAQLAKDEAQLKLAVGSPAGGS